MSLFQKETMSSPGFDIVIGELSNLNGDVVSKGAVRIDGDLKGNIEAKGPVVIGESAQVFGNIVASQIEISGRVEGNIDSVGKLRIYSSGILKGDIKVMSFDIDEGGAFEGMCRINTAAFSRRSTEPKPAPSKDNAKVDTKAKSTNTSATIESIKSKTESSRANRTKTQTTFQPKSNKNFK